MGDLSKTKACNNCDIEKTVSRFEVMKGGYVRPTCRDCYNARRRAIQGGEERVAERRFARANEIAFSYGSKVIGVYTDEKKSRRVKIEYKGFQWDIRLSSFLIGNKPWSRYSHKKFQEGFFVYKFVDCGEKCLYIGKSKKLSRRISQHFSPSEIGKYKTFWKLEVSKVFVVKCQTEADMHLLEMYMIGKDKPLHNKDALSGDDITFTLDVPEFEEMWVSHVYDKKDALPSEI